MINSVRKKTHLCDKKKKKSEKASLLNSHEISAKMISDLICAIISASQMRSYSRVRGEAEKTYYFVADFANISQVPA